MAEKTQALMTKYLQVLGGVAGKDVDNLRAKMAWFLAQEFFASMPTMPVSVKELATSLEASFQQQFPFCERIEIQEKGLDGIEAVVSHCFLKEANRGLKEKYELNLCPIDPFLIFVFSRGFSQNAWLADNRGTDYGCIMEFSLSNRCSCQLNSHNTFHK